MKMPLSFSLEAKSRVYSNSIYSMTGAHILSKITPPPPQCLK